MSSVVMYVAFVTVALAEVDGRRHHIHMDMVMSQELLLLTVILYQTVLVVM